jgi:hypothetical protein
LSESQQLDLRRVVGNANEALHDIDFVANAAHFTPGQILLAREIRAGVKEEHRYLSAIRHVALSGQPQDAAARMAEFIKSVPGFDFIHNADKSWNDLPEETQKRANEIIGDYLGGLDKAGLIDDCVKAIRTERVGTVLAYFLSGRLEHDLLDHGSSSGSESGGPKPELMDFLRKCIHRSDMGVTVKLKEIKDKDGARGEAVIFIDDIESKNQNKGRKTGQVDHFVLVKDPDGYLALFARPGLGGNPSAATVAMVIYRNFDTFPLQAPSLLGL